MKKLLALLFFFILTFLAFATTHSKNNPKENLVNTVRRLQNEVASIVLGREELSCELEKLQSDADNLLLKLSEAIHKVDHQIAYRKDELEKLKNKVNDLYDRGENITSKNKELNQREKNVYSQLKKNPELRNLVHINDLNKVNKEWHILAIGIIKKIPTYFEKVEAFKNRLEKLPKK